MSVLLGYARVSTAHQKLDIQINRLAEEGVRDDRIFTDKATGSNDDREGLKFLLNRAERGDTILITKLDRLGRNTGDMIKIIDSLYAKGVSVRFLDDGISTEGTMGRMVVTILAAVAQAERERILERTNEGRIAALENGTKFGRKPHKDTSKIVEMLAEGNNPNQVAKDLGIARSICYRVKTKLEEAVTVTRVSVSE